MNTVERARIAALTLHAQVDGTTHTAPARAAFLASFETRVDPDGVLDPAERERRARSLHRAHMLKLAAKSADARRRKAS